MYIAVFDIGAGRGNRTPGNSLESCGITIIRYPREEFVFFSCKIILIPQGYLVKFIAKQTPV
jgi:hypothetical protein